MKQKSIFAFLLVTLMTVASSAQNKVVTNSDLEKFKEKRVQAETEYDRQAQLGKVPTREELQRRELERQKALSEFARQKAIEEAAYWRAQASELQNQNQAYATALLNSAAAAPNYNYYPQQPIFYGFGGFYPNFNGYYNSFGTQVFGNIGLRGNGRLRGGIGFGSFQRQQRINNSGAIKVHMPAPASGSIVAPPVSNQNGQPNFRRRP